MARMDPAQRREAIVDAALRTAVREGLAATTVRHVATQMGTSPGLVHHYFDSMDDLLAEVFARVAELGLAATRTALVGVEDPADQLEVFLATYLHDEHEQSFQLWLDAWSEAARRPAVRQTSRALNVAWQQLLGDILRRGARECGWDCPDPDGAAWRILSLLDGLVLQQVAHDLPLSRDTVLDWVRRSARAELGLTLQERR